jgi:hypothetical protein
MKKIKAVWKRALPGSAGGCFTHSVIKLGLNEREERLDRSMHLFERLSQGIILDPAVGRACRV